MIQGFPILRVLAYVAVCVPLSVVSNAKALHAQESAKVVGLGVAGGQHGERLRTAQRVVLRKERHYDTRTRITTFLRELALVLPGMARDTDTLSDDQLIRRVSATSMRVYNGIAPMPPRDILVRDGSAWWTSDSYISLVPWMDSVARAWQSSDVATRTAWCLVETSSFKYNFSRALFQLAERSEYLPAVERVADASMTFAARTRNVERADEFRSFGHLLRGGIALAAGDTVRAMQEFRATIQWPRAYSVKSAVQSFAALASRRQDSTDRFMAYTLRQLLLRDASSQSGNYYSLRRAYHDIVSGGKAPPDIFPQRMRHDPKPSPEMSLDAYLDRQWRGLFDRSLPMDSVAPSASRTKSSRLVVVEYLTGQGCGGCWVEDIGLQSLARRYPPDQVLTLAWHYHPPLAGTTGRFQWAERYNGWYPTFFESKGHPRIPIQTLLTPPGDTLLGQVALVNGHALPRRSPAWWTMSKPASFQQRAVAVIERERGRFPEAALRMTVDTRRDSVHVRVMVDSLRGNSHQLAMRIVLFADTMWKRGGNDRRLYTNVVQDAAHDDTLELGLPLRGAAPVTLTYSFDLAEIQAGRWAERDEGLNTEPNNLPDMTWRINFPDPRDWELDRTRLHVVAFVQDLETGDILQAVRAKVPVTAPSKVNSFSLDVGDVAAPPAEAF
jgi:hypothetical protein